MDLLEKMTVPLLTTNRIQLYIQIRKLKFATKQEILNRNQSNISLAIFQATTVA